MCPLCKSTKFKKLGIPSTSIKAKPLLKNDYSVVQCNNCDYYFVFPEIDFSPQEWSFLYDDEYFPAMTKRHAKARRNDRIKRIRNINRLVNREKSKFLDVGCGEGYMLLKALSQGWDVSGIDIVDNRVPDAKISAINFLKSDLLSADYPSDYFDSIFIDSVLEHVINPAEYLSEIKRILKPGGVAYIGVPNEDCLLNNFRVFAFKLLNKSHISKKIKPFSEPYHVGGFNKKSLKYAMQLFSLDILIFRNFAGRFKFLNSKIFSRDFFVALAIEPFSLLSIPLRREDYLEVYVRKN